jgi:hypothetical protein
MKRIGALACVLLVGVLAAVSAVAQGAAPAAAPGSFAWRGEETPFEGGPESLKARVHAAVEASLSALGCSPAAGVSPDFYVIAHLARRDPEAPLAGLAALVVDLVDAPTSRLIWRSFDSDLSGAAVAQAGLVRGKSYSWREMPARPGVEQPFTRADRHIRNAMEAVMLFRDWRVASDPAAADAFIAYRVTATGEADKDTMSATLAIELMRRGASAVEWRGERTMTVPEPADLEDAVIEAVVDIARDYRDGRPSTAHCRCTVKDTPPAAP